MDIKNADFKSVNKIEKNHSESERPKTNIFYN